MKSPLAAEKVVCLTFDDIWKSQINFCFPALLEYGFRGTFFVSSEIFSSKIWPGWLADTCSLKDLHESGMEIGQHLSHGGLLQQFEKGLEYVDKKLAGLGIPKPVTFCYPGFKSPGDLRTEIEKRYLISRVGVSNEYKDSFDGKSGLVFKTKGSPFHPVFCMSVFGPNYGADRFKKDFEKLGRDDIGILCFHNVGEEPEGNSDGALTISEKEFIRVMNILKDADSVTVCLRELSAIRTHPVLESPYRSPTVVSKTLRPWIEGKSVYELGAAFGDNLLHFLWDSHARKIGGVERLKGRVNKARSRGLDVVQGNFFSDLPPADVYYFWDYEGTHYRIAEHLKSLKRNLTFIVGADCNVKAEVKMSEKIARDFHGEILRVSFNEGPGWRQSGEFMLVVCEVKT